MKPIGGYFSLELSFHEEYYKDAIRLNTGRNCLEYILRARKYRKVYIPFYTCDVILEPFHKLNVEYEFYHIDINFEISQEIALQKGEAMLYTNYYGLKQRYVEKLAQQYGSQLIVDNTQAFYANPIMGIDTFYTCRKFFGVPDGAYLYTDKLLEIGLDQDVSWNRMSFLTKRLDLGAEAGYADFREQSEKLVGQPIKLMSNLSLRIMQSIDYEAAAMQRRSNFITLQDSLGESNKLNLRLEDDAVPMVYPYMTDKEGLRDHLIRNKVFVARYWPNVLEWTDTSDFEHSLVSLLLPLPCDQRYSEQEMRKVISLFNR